MRTINFKGTQNSLTTHNHQQYIQKVSNNTNRTSSCSSMNQTPQIYNQNISPLDYKVSNPSSSLIMSSLSNIREDDMNDIQNIQSTITNQILGYGPVSGNFQKGKKQGNSIHNQFYDYLMEEDPKGLKSRSQFPPYSYPIHNQIIRDDISFESTQRKSLRISPQDPINTRNEYAIHPSGHNRSNQLHRSVCSAEQSLQYVEQSQEQLSFLKYKLQQAYEKLERQILNSYELEQKLQQAKLEIYSGQQYFQLQRNQNQKLKFTLKAILRNKSILEEEVEKGQRKANGKQQHRQKQLKQTLKCQLQLNQTKLQLKQTKLQLKQTTKQFQDKIYSLAEQNTKLTAQLSQLNKQLQKLKGQVEKRDKYLQNLSQQLQNVEEIKMQNKKLILKQNQRLNKINVLETELRKVTDEKVTSVNRLKHQIALVQQQNGQLLQVNQDLSHKSYMLASVSNATVTYSPGSVPKRTPNRSCSKVSVSRNPRISNNMNTPKPAMIFESQNQEYRQIRQFQNDVSQQTFNQFGSDSLNDQSVNTSLRRNRQGQRGKENIQTQNQLVNGNRQACGNRHSERQPAMKNTQGVGKWKQAQSVSNNFSTQFQSTQNQQSMKQYQQLMKCNQQSMKKSQQQTSQKACRVQSLAQTKVFSPQSQDQKLTKYQQHRKNLENQLGALQKIKRTTKQQRQKIDKLQKQLYYVDSDIAGLKRRIRRKY